ncbi:unnamed protein product [Anisakis simplex]|uniref:CX domain-containing protein n=1 Tax=Anisakis simplex TaxID=6269 RepID=A0A0M3IY44_ANISI|nr:unnamed protein product [Anisakis simplex]
MMFVFFADGYRTFSNFRWNHRPYYWGSSYYPQSMSRSNMCRMPIDASDPKFGNVYFEDGSSRPKEIVWSCGYNEDCCGYECCPSRGGGWGYGGAASSWRFGLGYVITFLIVVHRF